MIHTLFVHARPLLVALILLVTPALDSQREDTLERSLCHDNQNVGPALVHIISISHGMIACLRCLSAA